MTDQENQFAESIQYVPEDFDKTQDNLLDEAVPEVPDEDRAAVAPTGEVAEKPSGGVDVKPEVEGDAITKEMQELKDRIEKAERRAGYWQRQAEKKAAEVQTPPIEEAKKAVESDLPKPKMEDFDNDEEYFEALADWKVEGRLRDYRQQEAQKVQSAEKETFEQRLFNEGVGKYSDFAEVVMDPTVPITSMIVDILRETENPPEIAYFLGKNPSEAVRISRLNPLAAAREIGKIETKLMSDVAQGEPAPKPPAKPISKAPQPITPVKGGSSVSVSKDPEAMSNEEYRRWRMGR